MNFNENEKHGRIYNIIADFLEFWLLPDKTKEQKYKKQFGLIKNIQQELLILLTNKNASVRERARTALGALGELQGGLF